MMHIPVAAGSGFGSLHQAVNALQHGIGAVPLGINGLRSIWGDKSAMENVIYIFGDESGNFDFTNNEGDSRYFILTTVTLKDCSVGDALLKLRREMAWKDVVLTEQFHAASDCQEVRDQVFKCITTFDFRVDATVLEKKKTIDRYRLDVSRFYQLAWWLHLTYLRSSIVVGDNVLLVAASLTGVSGLRRICGENLIVFRKIVISSWPSMAPYNG